MLTSTPVVGIFDFGMFSVISNGNGDIHPFYAKVLIMYVKSTGDSFHEYISNKVLILHGSYFDTLVSCNR